MTAVRGAMARPLEFERGARAGAKQAPVLRTLTPTRANSENTGNMPTTASLARSLLLFRARPQSVDGGRVFITLVEEAMLHWAAVFFVIALIAALFGFGGIAAGAASIAKVLFVLFIVLAIVALVMGRRAPI
jgi:uncharacterized membrane protein YtjA (UPF0391 family)